MRAFIGVDIQKDFCEGGNLAVEGGNHVAAKVAEFLSTRGDEYGLIVFTRDWHIDPGHHFALTGTPDFQESFPVHCVAGTPGAKFHLSLNGVLYQAEAFGMDPVIVSKGQHAASFSGFDGKTEEGVGLATFLRAYGVNEVELGGIATDFCIKATALDAVANGFRTTVFTDLVAGITAGGIENAYLAMAEVGVRVRTTKG